MMKRGARSVVMACLVLLAGCGSDTAGGSGSGGGGSGGGGSGGGGSGGGGSGGGGSGGGGAGGMGGMGCLGEDSAGAAGFAGGACDAIRNPSKGCAEASLAVRTCDWLTSNARQSVFQAVRTCFQDDAMLCTGADPAAAVRACTDRVFAQACPAAGVTVGGSTVDCTAVHASCAAVDVAACNRLMSAVKPAQRQRAYECFVAAPTGAGCEQAFKDCVGLPK